LHPRQASHDAEEATHGISLKSLSADEWTFCEGLLEDPLYRDFPSYEIIKRGRIKLEDSMDPTTCLPYLLAFLRTYRLASRTCETNYNFMGEKVFQSSQMAFY
jgi:hypothetical protein